jgi:hypothetical protein
MTTPRYPDVALPLCGMNGSKVAILERVRRAMKEHQIDHLFPQFWREVAGGDTQTLVDAIHRWFTVD